MIDAQPGSGKTYMLCQLAKRWKKKALYTAYNSNAVTLAKETMEDLNRLVWCKTTYSQGLATMSRKFPGAKYDRNKYRDIADDILLPHMVLMELDGKPLNSGAEQQVKQGLISLCEFVRKTLTDPTDEAAIRALIEKHAVFRGSIQPGFEDEIVEMVPEMVEEGRKIKRKLDYVDMVWLPYELDLRPPQFPMIFADECQDYSPAQQWIIEHSLAPGGRIIMAGDPNQAINAFNGSDSRSFMTMVKKFNAVGMPMTVTFRCPRRVVRQLQERVPEIRWAEEADEGFVDTVSTEDMKSRVKPGDLILCRTNSPLMITCLDLIGEGHVARINGKPITAMLISELKRMKGMFHDFSWKQFDKFTYEYLAVMKEIIFKRKRHSNNRTWMDLKDIINCLERVWDRAETQPNSIAAMRDSIEGLFGAEGDRSKQILLSTVHSIKGDQADVVWILWQDPFSETQLMPHPLAMDSKNPEEMIQEDNLIHVAESRAAKELYYVTPWGRHGPHIYTDIFPDKHLFKSSCKCPDCNELRRKGLLA